MRTCFLKKGISLRTGIGVFLLGRGVHELLDGPSFEEMLLDQVGDVLDGQLLIEDVPRLDDEQMGPRSQKPLQPVGTTEHLVLQPVFLDLLFQGRP